MPPVFAHGQLRLYLLALLEQRPMHGYEVITALSDRFGGTYRPSAGTIYPRLAQPRGGRPGAPHRRRPPQHLRAHRCRPPVELEDRRGELAALEQGIAETVRDRAARVRDDVRGTMSGLRAELAAAAQEARAAAPAGAPARTATPARPRTCGSPRPTPCCAASATTCGPSCAGPTPPAGSRTSPSRRCARCSTRPCRPCARRCAEGRGRTVLPVGAAVDLGAPGRLSRWRVGSLRRRPPASTAPRAAAASRSCCSTSTAPWPTPSRSSSPPTSTRSAPCSPRRSRRRRARAWIGRPLLPALLEESPEHGHELDRVYREWNLANTARLIQRYAGVPELLADLTAAGVTVRRRHVEAAGDGPARPARAWASTTSSTSSRRWRTPPPTSRHPTRCCTPPPTLGVDPADCVYVGDATVDVLAARAAGMAAVAVTWGAGERDGPRRRPHPDALVDSGRDLATYLLGRRGG